MFLFLSHTYAHIVVVFVIGFPSYPRLRAPVAVSQYLFPSELAHLRFSPYGALVDMIRKCVFGLRARRVAAGGRAGERVSSQMSN